MSLNAVDEKTRKLFQRIREKCRDRRWFGADCWMEPMYMKWPPFQWVFPKVLSEKELGQVEQQLGFSLPPLLRGLYLHLANGEICFGYGILPAKKLLQEYQALREESYFEGAWRWPEQLLPLCFWGCSLYSLVDRELGTILFTDIEALSDGGGDFVVEARDLEGWLERWITKEDEVPYLGAPWQEAAGDPQARAMGLEVLQDEPGTPIPVYVSEWRRLLGTQ